MLDTAGLVPNFAGPRTVTTAPILGGATTDAAAKKEAQHAKARRGASRSPRGPVQVRDTNCPPPPSLPPSLAGPC